MYVLLENTASRILLEIDTWQSLLQIAQDNGWDPEGIEPIDYFSTDTTPLGTGYTPRRPGMKCKIRNSDAKELGKAIYKAMMRKGLIKPKKIKLRDDGVITDLDELIQVRNFIESGAFIVERVEEDDKEKYSRPKLSCSNIHHLTEGHFL